MSMLELKRMPDVDNDAPKPQSLQKASSLSSKCLRGDSLLVKMSEPTVHPNIQEPCNSLSNLLDPHGRDHKQHYQDLKGTGVKKIIEMIRSAQTRHLSQDERLKEQTWRKTIPKDEPADSFNKKDNEYLPHFILTRLSSERTACFEDAHDFELTGPEICSMPILPDVRSYVSIEQVHGHFCPESLSNVRRGQFTPSYLARGDRYRIYDLRDLLGKRRIYCQDKLSGFSGHVGAFGTPLGGIGLVVWSRFSVRASKKFSLRIVKRAICKNLQAPKYDYRLDVEEENADFT
ncbi:hypothetical protein L7F22_042827 [Adiantum nelumboides]|nr:hypothetical protein [Adiantum nelumboides]